MFANVFGHHVFAVSILDSKGFAKNAVILAGSGGATQRLC